MLSCLERLQPKMRPGGQDISRSCGADPLAMDLLFALLQCISVHGLESAHSSWALVGSE